MSKLRQFVLPAACCCLLIPTSLLRAAQEEEPEETTPKPVPIAVAAVSSVERVLECIDYVFLSVDRPEIAEFAAAQLANVRDLKGVDRNRPLGVIVFLKPGLIPQPDFVGFLPVDDFAELLQTLAVGPVQPAKVPETEGRYSIQAPGNTIYFEQLGTNVFFARSEELLDLELPEPATLTKSLMTRYDVAAQLKIGTIPVAMRTVLLDFIRAAMQANMQHRDEEPESFYRLRKASGNGNLKFLEHLLMQGDSFTVGVDVSPELKSAVIEMDLNARPGSEFAKLLEDFGGKVSYYRPLQKDPSVVSAFLSQRMDKDTQDMLTEIVTQGQAAIEVLLAENPQTMDQTVRLQGLADTLLGTIEAGIFDGFFRIQMAESGEATLLASVRVSGGTRAAETIGDLLTLLQTVEGSDRVELQLNADQHQGVIFHRVKPVNQGADPMRRAFAGDDEINMYFGAGERTLWFVLGGKEAMPAAKAAIDRILDPAAQRDLAGTAPVQFSFSMSQWMAMWANPDREPEGMQLTMQENFAAGQDRILFDVNPKENGIRYRIRFEEGFIRAAGLGLSVPFDRMIENSLNE